MRGTDDRQQPLFSVVALEQRVPADHPLRAIRQMTDEALVELSPLFERLYAKTGRPSIAPERLLRALLLQVLYSVRSERMLMEQLDYNLLFRWFVGLTPDEPVWVPTVFTKNRDRLLEGEVATAFFGAVLGQAKAKNLTSSEHFTVDGTLVEAWAGHKSFKPIDAETPKDGEEPPPPDDPGNPTVNFKKTKRSNATHRSTTDPDARLYKKSDGTPAELAYLGHVLMENRHGLLVDCRLTLATGTAEREAALEMVRSVAAPGVTLGADKGYDVREFVERLQALDVAPHIARHTNKRSSAVPETYEQDGGYQVSQRKRKLVEEGFGWMKAVGMIRQVKHRGLQKVQWLFTFTAAAYNLVRLRRLATCA
jgi:transposase